MLSNKKTRTCILIVCIALILISILAIVLLGKNMDKRVKVGFILNGSTTEEGWNGLHYRGIKGACEKLNVDLIVKENVAEFSGQCPKAVDELVKEGASMIVLSSYNYTAEMEPLFDKYDKIIFFSNSFDFDAPNVAGYMVRYYQARYMAGIVAGMQTTTNEIGYVAALENSEVNRGINAFTLGVRSVNPEAVVKVAWTGSWNDAEKEKQIARELIDNTDVDLLAYHQNQTNVVQVAEEYGMMSIGYHQMHEGSSDKHLTAVVCDWEKTYMEVIGAYLKNRATANKVSWLGVEADTVQLAPCSPLVSEECLDAASAAKQSMVLGKNIFSDEIWDNQGNKRCSEGEALSDEMLLKSMDWFVEGVEFYNVP